MDKRLWNAPGDAEFDRLLAASLPDPPPDEVARAVTPWRRVMEQLVWGLALTGITLQVGGLQYWLPALGTLLCLLAFRTVRRENPWLRAGWMVSAVRTGAVWAVLILNAFLWRQTPAGQTVMTVLTGAGQLAQLGQLDIGWQVNASALLHWRSRKLALELLRQARRPLLASDCHNLGLRPPNLNEGRTVVMQKLGEAFLARMDQNAAELIAPAGEAAS